MYMCIYIYILSLLQKLALLWPRKLRSPLWGPQNPTKSYPNGCGPFLRWGNHQSKTMLRSKLLSWTSIVLNSSSCNGSTWRWTQRRPQRTWGMCYLIPESFTWPAFKNTMFRVLSLKISVPKSLTNETFNTQCLECWVWRYLCQNLSQMKHSTHNA